MGFLLLDRTYGEQLYLFFVCISWWGSGCTMTGTYTDLKSSSIHSRHFAMMVVITTSPQVDIWHCRGIAHISLQSPIHNHLSPHRRRSLHLSQLTDWRMDNTASTNELVHGQTSRQHPPDAPANAAPIAVRTKWPQTSAPRKRHAHPRLGTINTPSLRQTSKESKPLFEQYCTIVLKYR